MSEKLYDAYGNEVVTNANSFTLCQTDVKISDTKFETKTTTFIKDAFRRFCKNKSSVVGAIIIGLLVLLSIIVPIVSPFSMESENIVTVKLPPKISNNKNGTFWNGLVEVKDISWDFEKNCPVSYEEARSVVKIIDQDDAYQNLPSASALDGYGSFVITSDSFAKDARSPIIYLINYTPFKINTTDNYKVVIDIENLDKYDDFFATEFRILLVYKETATSKSTSTIILRDWSTDYDKYEYNLSQVLVDNGIEETPAAQIKIEAKLSDENLIFLAVKDVHFSCDSNDEEVTTLLDQISFHNVSKLVQMQKDSTTSKFPVGYWQATGNKKVYNVLVHKVSFIYDPYAQKLGTVSLDEAKSYVGESDVNRYIANGWCLYDFEVGPSSFVKLSDKCPIESVSEQIDHEAGTSGIKTRYVHGEVTIWKELGYNRMPKFLFGTDGSGYDLVTRCFTYLLRSFALAICTSAFCFIFGLCWGAISGYFGGNVDLFMERFCDILYNIPGVVVLTLTILLLDDKGISKTIQLGIALCLTGWMSTAGRTRTQFYRFKGREYILASRTLGANDLRLIFRHILPNAMGTIITGSVLMVPGVIFSEASLSYLGLISGMKSFGTILSTNQIYLSTYPFLIIFPAIIISLIMISFNLFGNGLRDAFNPSLKGSE